MDIDKGTDCLIRYMEDLPDWWDDLLYLEFSYIIVDILLGMFEDAQHEDPNADALKITRDFMLKVDEYAKLDHQNEWMMRVYSDIVYTIYEYYMFEEG